MTLLPNVVERLADGWGAWPRRAVASTGLLDGAMMVGAGLWAPQGMLVRAIGMNTANLAPAQSGATLVRMGLYEHDLDSGTLNLLGATAHDSTLFSALSQHYARALQIPVPIYIGRRYVVCAVQVGAVGFNLSGRSVAAAGTGHVALNPAAAISSSGHSDLPAQTPVVAAAFLPYVAVYESLPG